MKELVMGLRKMPIPGPNPLLAEIDEIEAALEKKLPLPRRIDVKVPVTLDRDCQQMYRRERLAEEYPEVASLGITFPQAYALLRSKNKRNVQGERMTLGFSRDIWNRVSAEQKLSPNDVEGAKRETPLLVRFMRVVFVMLVGAVMALTALVLVLSHNSPKPINVLTDIKNPVDRKIAKAICEMKFTQPGEKEGDGYPLTIAQARAIGSDFSNPTNQAVLYHTWLRSHDQIPDTMKGLEMLARYPKTEANFEANFKIAYYGMLQSVEGNSGGVSFPEVLLRFTEEYPSLFHP